MLIKRLLFVSAARPLFLFNICSISDIDSALFFFIFPVALRVKMQMKDLRLLSTINIFQLSRLSNINISCLDLRRLISMFSQSFLQGCGSGINIPDPNFFHPGSEFFASRIRIKEF
jgi:hypothetical protein